MPSVLFVLLNDGARTAFLHDQVSCNSVSLLASSDLVFNEAAMHCLTDVDYVRRLVMGKFYIAETDISYSLIFLKS
jgi:hypothetical protein